MQGNRAGVDLASAPVGGATIENDVEWPAVFRHCAEASMRADEHSVEVSYAGDPELDGSPRNTGESGEKDPLHERECTMASEGDESGKHSTFLGRNIQPQGELVKARWGGVDTVLE